MEKLQIGDVIYTHQYSTYTKHVIDRVTEKNAFSGSMRFLREPDGNDSYKIVGPGSFGPYRAEKMNDRIQKYVTVSEYKQAIDALIKKLEKARNSTDGLSIEEAVAKTAAIKTICESI